MILPTLVFLFKNSIIQKILEIAGKHSYSDLKNNFHFYKVLEELGIEKPKDEQERLYLHSAVLFAAKGKHEELVKLLLLKDSKDAFFKEIRNNEEGAFLRELDDALHTKSFIKEIKNWQQVPDDDIQEFIGIYQDLINLVATPVQHAVLNETRSLSASMTNRHRENQENFQDIKKEIQELKASLVLPQSHVTELLQQEYERQLTVILQTLNDGKVRQALNEFETLREQLWSQLELKLRFKLLTNLGVAYFKLNEQEKAAPLLIEAYEIDPDSKLGWSNMVNAYLSLGDTENAEKYISAFIHKFPDTISAYSAFIKLKAEDYTVDEIRAMVPVLIRDDVDITTALGLAARQREEFQLSIELLRTAKKLKPDDRYINQQLLQSWLEVLARNYKLINLRILTEEDKTNLVALLDIIHKEQELTDVHENPLAKANFYLAEGFVLFLLKRNRESSVANNKGLEIDPESVFLRKQQGMLFAFSGDLDGAINMLNGIKEYEYMPDVPLLLSEIYRNNGQYEEAINLIEEKRHTITDKKFIAQSKFVLLDLYIRQKSDEKIAILERELSTDTISDLISLARIAVYRNNKEDSKTYLKQAIKLAEEDVNFRERFLLAEQLFKYEMYDEAIVQLENISDPTVPSEINNYLGRAYRKAGRTADTLKLLSLIREHNGPMKGYTEEEVNIYIHELSNYSSARDILEAYLARFDNEFGMELQLNEVNMRLELFDKVAAFFIKPIKIWELPHSLVRVYVAQLLKRNYKKRAVELTYEYRRIKNNEEAHVLFLQTLLQYPDAKEGVSEKVTVTRSCVVTLLDRSNKDYVLIIEDRPENELLDIEINPSHPRFEKLKGKSIGQQVQFDNNFTKWTISSIEPKYSYAFRESMEKCSTIYSETSPFTMFHADDMPEVLGQLIDSNWTKNYQVALEYYKAGRIPLGSFAQNFNRHSLLVWEQLRSIRTVGVRCCDGQGDRLQENNKLLLRKTKLEPRKTGEGEDSKETDNLENVLFKQSAKRLCADIVTLATIFELEIVEQITTLFGKILITESTWDTLLSYKQDVEAFGNDENKKVNNLLEFVRKYTEIQQPSILIELNGLDKDRSDDLLGRSFHETLLLAAEQKAILFTDDIALSNLAKSEHRIDSTWSQGIAYFMLTSKWMAREEYEESVIKLIGMNYQHTYINQVTMVTALRSYGIESLELENLLRMMQGQNTSIETATFVVYAFIIEVWRNSFLIPTQCEELTYRTILHLITNRVLNDIMPMLIRLSLVGHQAPGTHFGRYIYFQIDRQIKNIQSNFGLN